MNSINLEQLEKWNRFIEREGRNPELLEEILADDVIFRSPVVWTPQLGKAVTTRYLIAASRVLKKFKYTRKLAGENSFGLEFTAQIGDVSVVGIDLIEFNEVGLIKDFEVMVRPAKALQAIADAMRQQLSGEVSA